MADETWLIDGGSPSSVTRPVELEAVGRLRRFWKLNWRRERWGGVYLTEREYEALTLEMQFLQRFNADLAAIRKQVETAHRARVEADLKAHGKVEVACRSRAGHYERLSQQHEAALRKTIRTNVNKQIAGKMDVTPQRVGQLLRAASNAIAWLEEFDPAFAGWRLNSRGQWVLDVPVAKVACAQAIRVDFTPLARSTEQAA